MTIDLNKDQRSRVVASIERYFDEQLGERIGNIAAGALLGFFLEELGPLIYNQAIQDAQARLAERVSELDIELHEDEFPYWPKHDKSKKSR
jgi:uncharacterized protein (DUF2164 family)